MLFIKRIRYCFLNDKRGSISNLWEEEELDFEIGTKHVARLFSMIRLRLKQ